MLSYNRKLKGIVLTEHITTVEGHFIIWNQMISKEGKICGISSFQQKTQEQKEQQRRGDWNKTLQNRIKARREKGKDWRDY